MVLKSAFNHIQFSHEILSDLTVLLCVTFRGGF